MSESETEVRVDWTPAQLAAEIAMIIRQRPALWDQRNWYGFFVNSTDQMRAILAGSEELACGTTGCVAGWAAVLVSPPGTRLASGGGVYRPGDLLRGETEALAAEALNLNYFQAHWLFASFRSLKEVLWALDLIAAGQLDWDPDDFGV